MDILTGKQPVQKASAKGVTGAAGIFQSFAWDDILVVHPLPIAGHTSLIAKGSNQYFGTQGASFLQQSCDIRRVFLEGKDAVIDVSADFFHIRMLPAFGKIEVNFGPFFPHRRKVGSYLPGEVCVDQVLLLYKGKVWRRKGIVRDNAPFGAVVYPVPPIHSHLYKGCLPRLHNRDMAGIQSMVTAGIQHELAIIILSNRGDHSPFQVCPHFFQMEQHIHSVSGGVAPSVLVYINTGKSDCGRFHRRASFQRWAIIFACTGHLADHHRYFSNGSLMQWQFGPAGWPRFQQVHLEMTESSNSLCSVPSDASGPGSQGIIQRTFSERIDRFDAGFCWAGPCGRFGLLRAGPRSCGTALQPELP